MLCTEKMCQRLRRAGSESLAGLRQANLFWIFAPAGPVAAAERNAVFVDLGMLALVVIPALALLIGFAWFYRKRRRAAGYDPGFSHSAKVEAIVWGVPLLIVGLLGVFSWITTHDVNPYDPKILADVPVATATKPLQVDVIATDWQWLFVYPQQHVAVANELVLPRDRRVDFRLTSTAVMNSFFIPQVVGQIYAMPGMRTRQATLVERNGTYHGFSAEFSGAGFSWMHYPVKVVSPADFHDWLAQAAAAPVKLNWSAFERFAQPTVHLSGGPTLFSTVQPGLFDTVVHAVRDGALKTTTPIYLSENMDTPRFLAHAD